MPWPHTPNCVARDLTYVPCARWHNRAPCAALNPVFFPFFLIFFFLSLSIFSLYTKISPPNPHFSTHSPLKSSPNHLFFGKFSNYTHNLLAFTKISLNFILFFPSLLTLSLSLKLFGVEGCRERKEFPYF